MYKFSMEWFMQLFLSSVDASEQSSNLGTRVAAICDHFTYFLYANVCQALFERDKLLFSFMLTIKLLEERGEVDPGEWFFFMTGGTTTGNVHDNELPGWLSDKTWTELVNLNALPRMRGILRDVVLNASEWRLWCEHGRPEVDPMLGRWETKLGLLQRILVLRVLVPDKVRVGA